MAGNGEQRFVDVSQEGNSIDFQCKKCNTLNAFIMPKMEINNQATYSMAIFIHENPQCCTKCGTPHQIVMKEVIVKSFGIFSMKVQEKGSGLYLPHSDIIKP
jgi:hypothetical protein